MNDERQKLMLEALYEQLNEERELLATLDKKANASEFYVHTKIVNELEKAITMAETPIKKDKSTKNAVVMAGGTMLGAVMGALTTVVSKELIKHFILHV